MRYFATALLGVLGIAQLVIGLVGFHGGLGHDVTLWPVWISGAAFFCSGLSYSLSGSTLNTRLSHLFTAGALLLGLMCANYALQDTAQLVTAVSEDGYRHAVIDVLWTVGFIGFACLCQLLRMSLLESRRKNSQG